MNKERFHNALAIILGYEQIVKNKRYNIIVDDNADEPKVIIKDANGYTILKFTVFEVEGIKQNGLAMNNDLSINNDLNKIVDAVHQAYIQAMTRKF